MSMALMGSGPDDAEQNDRCHESASANQPRHSFFPLVSHEVQA
jgi:hypothetical protein